MTLTEKNILITGGAGFIGSHLCEAIAFKKPRSLIIVDNLFLGKESNLREAKLLYPGLRFYKDSICDYKRIKKIILENNIDVVFNLAVIPLPASLIKPKMAFEENVNSVLNLCELAREKCFKTLIHCSSSEVYGTAQRAFMNEKHPLMPTTPYAASKAAADQLCLSYTEVFGIDLSIVRPFNNYGPRQNKNSYAGIVPIVINRLLEGKPIEIYGDGNQTRDFIFVRDTANAFIDVYESKNTRNKIINIAKGKEVSINKLVELIIKLMDIKSVSIKYLPSRPGDVRRHCADVKLARKLINFKSGIELEEGIVETIRWYKKGAVKK